MKRIFVSSPYSHGGAFADNTLHANLATRYVISLGHNPFTPHLFYPQFIDERSRALAMAMAKQVLMNCDELYVFTGLGISEGMVEEMETARRLGIPIKTVSTSLLQLEDIFSNAL
jgi:hypothetical protein